MQKVLANLLLEHAPLAALIDDHLHWDVMLPGAPFPNVVMFVISGVTNYTYSGPDRTQQNRIQFDSRGSTAADARAVADALTERLSGFRGEFQGTKFKGCFASGQRTRHEKVDGLEWFVDSRDFNIFWAPA